MVWSFFRFFKPLLFQGPRKRFPYFEAWHFKHVAAANGRAKTFSVLPGIVKNSSGEHAFIQTVLGPGHESRLFLFPISDFSYTDDPFGLSIGPNHFSMDGMRLRLADGHGSIQAEFSYSDTIRPKALDLSELAPLVTSRHGIASLRHRIAGFVDVREERHSFDGGCGYIEKNWGRSVPSAWIWVQSNEFPQELGPAAFSISLARVSLCGAARTACVCMLRIGGDEYHFDTYRGTHVDLLENGAISTRILLRNKRYKMEIQIRKLRLRTESDDSDSWLTQVESFANMNQHHLSESMESQLRIILKRRHGMDDDIIVDASSSAAAAEIAGDVAQLSP